MSDVLTRLRLLKAHSGTKVVTIGENATRVTLDELIDAFDRLTNIIVDGITNPTPEVTPPTTTDVVEGIVPPPATGEATAEENAESDQDRFEAAGQDGDPGDFRG